MSKKSNQKLHLGLDMIRKELNAIISKGYNGSRVFQDWIGVMFYAFLHDDPHYLEIMGQYRKKAQQSNRKQTILPKPPHIYWSTCRQQMRKFWECYLKSMLLILTRDNTLRHHP